ncbi:Lhr family helicase [Nocardioides sp. B-3]|uniref:Lhr family helicase n=1 Tax=Nocardioides sp. B-3 TaxID=2895565 RepID=UPI003FA59ED4
MLEALAPGGAWFFRQLSDRLGSTDDQALSTALWGLVWEGLVTNDTLTPLRALVRSGTASHRTRRAPPRTGRIPARTGPPQTAGRWSVLPARDPDATRRAHATAEHLLERHGVVTRGAVMQERIVGGFAGVYKVLSAFEDTGRCRRGYFVEGLGAAQFGAAGAIDRLRTFSEPDESKPLAPGARLDRPGQPLRRRAPRPANTGDNGHRPGRKAGALVVLVHGALTLYVERGGRTLLTRSDDTARLTTAAGALAEATRRGALGKLIVEKADGTALLGGGDTPLRQALNAAGFVSTPKGLRMRA